MKFPKDFLAGNFNMKHKNRGTFGASLFIYILMLREFDELKAAWIDLNKNKIPVVLASTVRIIFQTPPTKYFKHGVLNIMHTIDTLGTACFMRIRRTLVNVFYWRSVTLMTSLSL